MAEAERALGEQAEDTNTDSVWDMSDAPELRTEAPNAVDEVKFWSNEYNTAEAQFAKYTKAISPNARDEESYRATVAKYENDIAYDWQRLEEATNKAMTDRLIRSAYELADTQGLGIVAPDETIEAATGVFYDERMSALSQKILAQEQNDITVADQSVLRQTWRKVMDYIEASTDYDFLHRDYNSYQNARRTCHNNMIRQLNDLNHLAEKYGTTRFTPRDFMTNDFHYNQRQDRNSRLNNRANYDRESVLAYFRTVFEKDFSKMEQKAAYTSRNLQAGMMYYD